MNKANLKSYAPKARLDFIKAVTERANMLGITASGAAPAQVRGDVAIIDGTEWPAKVAAQRDQLIARMQREGFAQTCEAVAYTWFNRFAALRYMELHDYLGHGHRALSSSTGNLPDILTHAADLAQSGADSGLPGLNAAKVVEMKLAGNRDGELYRMLLVAQCNALNAGMPFLFERIDDDTELLLPDNLLRTDSVVAKLVQGVPEEDWAEVEVIGWLYQFYISEKKDQVIGKVVKSEDIPAATQLFTPNWIVQYLVQNSVGRLWLMANPASTLAGQWPYYIQPAEQTPEVQAQLDALIQTRMDEDGGSLNPETITVLDPACGSGHILVVAYDVLKAIYLERGYQARAIPRLILEKNLYGLDIDDRAAQMAGFALLMKARADDRRLFNEPPKLNVLSLQESKGLDAAALAQAINAGSTERVEVVQLRWLIDTFEHAKTFGSLIQIAHHPLSNLHKLLLIVQQSLQAGDLYAQAAAQDVLPLVLQALVLGMQFDAVVANPPYMGSKYLTPALKTYLTNNYQGFDKDLFSAFMFRNLALTKTSGQLGFMSPFVWMFISSYEELRIHFIENATLSSLVQLEYSGFDGATVPICTFTLGRQHFADFVGSYVRLTDFKGADQQAPRTLEAIQNRNCGWFYATKPDNFKKIPGSPVAYWISENLRNAFASNLSIGSIADTRKGMATGDNKRFVRSWSEVSFDSIGFGMNRESVQSSGKKWFPYANGGDFRKWFGNIEDVVLWENDGYVLQTELHESGRIRAVNLNLEYIFKEGVTWTSITSSHFSSRYMPLGCLFSSAANSLFPSSGKTLPILGKLNSNVFGYLSKVVNPTLNMNPGDTGKIPFPKNSEIENQVEGIVKKLIDVSKHDWDSREQSWDFSDLSWITMRAGISRISDAWGKHSAQVDADRQTCKSLEARNNSIFIEAYGLQHELSPEVPEEQITLARADREKDCQRLISYSIGCMMGRYSLDESGLVYAHAGNVGFDASRYATFPADADGIVPLTDERWFADDAASRVREFLLAVSGADTLEENMAWLAESLGTKASETPDETIRRYLADKFFKDHLQTYKKRPIYWLFSSGKQGAFQALVYLHRYTEGTLARLRAEYVVPLIAKVASRLDMLAQDVAAASSAAARTKLQKQIEALRKKQLELLAYDEKLRHYADMRITLDLDDGVKVNYGKFGDLLEGVKLVTGGAGDD
jgi:type II restriction/modification system DNA methylase subunit YeeA